MYRLFINKNINTQTIDQFQCLYSNLPTLRMNLPPKNTSRSFRSKNYRTDAMKLLNDLLTINTTNIGSSKGELNNSKNKKQFSRSTKSNSLIQKDNSATQTNWTKRQFKNLIEPDSKINHDTSIFSQRQEELNITSSGFPIAKTTHESGESKSLNSSFLHNEHFIEEEDQNKRNLVYELQSFKQSDPQISINNDSNKKIYDMVFYKKTCCSDNLSTNSSEKTTNVEGRKRQNMSIEEFQLGGKLGVGKFGQVFAARHKKLGFLCALKKIAKEGVQFKALVQLIRQIKIQSFLEHPNIAKLYNFFSDDHFVYLMMQYCASGDLYTFLKRRKRLDQICVQTMMRQVCKAVQYMHENNIIHRDLKPQNILLSNGMVKVSDFGWSISSTINRETFCGTPLYVSPQLLKRNNYNNKIDVWSVGILTHQLLFGRVPFDIFTEGDLIKIVQDDIYFSKKYKVSDNAKNLILNCLQKDPRDRCTISEILQYPFLKVDLDQSISKQHF